MEQCPIPTLLENGSFSQVLFSNVEKFYAPGGDVMCCYTLTEKFVPRSKDWIGIFKVGWKTTKEYYTFMWAPLPKDLNKDSATRQEIQFKAYYLPKDEECYQFCYVDEDGLVRGTSIPFQFQTDPDEDIMVVINKERVEEMEQLSEELYQENLELKDKYADLHEQLQRKQVALEATQKMNKSLEQEVEEKASWEEEKASWEGELLRLKEYNQKITSEKEAMAIRVEELQTQLATQEKEMEELIVRDQEKTEQLEQLKKENSQLTLSLTEQRKHWKTLEQTVEMLKEKRAVARKKEQELKEPKDKATTEEELAREVDHLKAKVEAGRACYIEKYKECQRLHKQIRQLRASTMIQNYNLSKQLSNSKTEYERLKKKISLLQDENKALQSSLDNKDVSSHEGAVKPEVPSTQGADKPEVPSTQGADKSEVPSTQGADKPEVPSNQGADKPEVPSTQGADKPEVPSNQGAASQDSQSVYRKNSCSGIQGSSCYRGTPTWEQLKPQDLYCPFCKKTYPATKKWVSWHSGPALIPVYTGPDSV